MKFIKVSIVFLMASAMVLGAATGAFAKGGKTRNYYIQAETVRWNYAPEENLIYCLDTPGPPCALPDVWTDPIWKKVRYIEYTDETFSEPVPQPEHLGIMGPIIRAEVGDKVVVHFRNHSRLGSFGIHPHLFRYDKVNEGAFYSPVNDPADPNTQPMDGAQVPPGGEFIYRWFADKDSSPGPGDPSSIVGWYHSHVDEPFETNLGLLGPVVVIKKGWAKEVVVARTTKGKPIRRPVPRDVDKELVACFFIFDEEHGEERGLMHSINGYIFGNLKGLEMNRGDRVRWYLMGMGNEVDLHTAHWHGKVVQVGNYWNWQKTDVIELLPGSQKTVTMKADNVGEWIFHCHVADHIYGGMMTTFAIYD